MKIKTIALATCLVMLFCLAALAVTACDFSDLRQYYTTETFTKFDGEIERNVTIRVLENDTAISVGYFDELLDAFNEAYAEYGITAVDANMDSYTDLALDGPRRPLSGERRFDGIRRRQACSASPRGRNGVLSVHPGSRLGCV